MAKKRRGRGEGTVFYSESKSCWIGRVQLGEKRKEVTGRSKAEALAKMRGATAEGTGAGRSPDTIGEYVAHWLDNVAAQSVEASTLSTYRYAADHLLTGSIASLLLRDCTPDRLEVFFGGLADKGLGGSRLRKVRTVLGSALKHAHQRGKIASVPLLLVRAPRLKDVEIRPFTADEVRSILATAWAKDQDSGGRYIALYTLAFATGMRRGELLGLHWPEVDLATGSLRVERTVGIGQGGQPYIKQPKTRRGRRAVTLPRFAVEALQSRRMIAERDGHLNAPAFCGRGGEIADPAVIQKGWVRLLRRAGVPHRSFHQIRHTHVSQLLAVGVPITEVARRVGDHPETILRIYAHHLPTDADVPGKLDRLYG